MNKKVYKLTIYRPTGEYSLSHTYTCYSDITIAFKKYMDRGYSGYMQIYTVNEDNGIVAVENLQE